MAQPAFKTVRTDVLEIAYEEHGPPEGRVAILLHGFPYDPRSFDEVAATASRAGWRVIVPYLRGYGPTRFLSPSTPRSGEQAALGHDLLQLMDALGIEQALLGGYDWGGRAACIVAALWPQRAGGLVSCTGYNIQNIAASVRPAAPEAEHRYWYQYYFHSERGRAGLAANRGALCELLWRLWSPQWKFTPATYAASAISFDNPDFVDVVIQSYRHRYAYAPGDPALEPVEARLAVQPPITVPTINLHGEADGVAPPEPTDTQARRFTGRYERRRLSGIGHNVPQEAPAAFFTAMQDLAK